VPQSFLFKSFRVKWDWGSDPKFRNFGEWIQVVIRFLPEALHPPLVTCGSLRNTR
jgi:hypothetical protein